MSKEETKELFVEALKKIVTNETSVVRFPFNVSKINDTMRGLKDTYNCQLTPFGRFSALLAEMETDGHCKSSRNRDSVELVDSKYAIELMRTPLTEEEKQKLKEEREAKRAERDAKRQAAREAEENGDENSEGDASKDDSKANGKEDAAEASNAGGNSGDEAASEVADPHAKSHSPSRSPSRSKSRSRSRSGSNE